MKNNQKIPEGWSVKRLGELANHVKYGIVDGPFGSNLKTEHYRNSGIPVIQSGFVTSQRFYAEKYLYVDYDLFQREKRSATHGNDIIMAKIGVHAGTSAILPENHPESILAGNCLKITINPMLANNRFILLTLHTKYDKDAFIDIKSTTAQPAISMENLKKLKLLLPPLPEQKKIAEILGTWDEAIEKLSSLIEQKKLLKKGLMQKLLTGKVRLPGFTQPWKEVKLGEIGTISSAGVDKKIVEGEDLVELLNYMDVYKKDFLYKTDTSMTVSAPMRQIKNCNLRKGDIFFTPSSETPDDIAHSAVVMEDIPNGVYSYHIIRLRPTTLIDLKFSAYAFKTAKFYKQAYAWCEGSGQRYVISQDDFRNMKIYIPSNISEQHAIAEVLSTADDEINLLNQKLEATKEQKKGLMQQLLTGQVRVKVN